MVLAGTAPGTHSRLNVSGLATLGGTLNVSLVAGCMPAPMNQFSVLFYGSRSGTFGGYSLPSLSYGVWQDPLQGYQSDRFTLRTLYF